MDFKSTPQNGNSYLHVWDVSTVKVYDGGFLLTKSNLPVGLKELPKATFLKVDLEERTAKAIKTVSLFEAITAASTEVKIKKGSLLVKNDVIGTGSKTVTVGDIDTSDAEYDSFAITADALGELEINATLQEFASGKPVNPDGFNYTDVKIDAQPSVSVVFKVYGVVSERLPFPITDEIIDSLKLCQILKK
ncbi:MAG: hypothetical protein ACK5M3_05585 [Dysgonomonas sp.]